MMSSTQEKLPPFPSWTDLVSKGSPDVLADAELVCKKSNFKFFANRKGVYNCFRR